MTLSAADFSFVSALVRREAAIWFSGSTSSASPAPTIAPGIPQTTELASSCASTSAPASRNTRAPSRPS